MTTPQIRVRLSAVGIGRGLYVLKPDREGTLVPWHSPYLHKGTVKVLWDGTKMPTVLRDYLIEEIK